MAYQQATTERNPIQDNNVPIVEGEIDYGFLCKEDQKFWDSVESLDAIGEKKDEVKLKEKFYENFPTVKRGIWKPIKRFLNAEADDEIITRKNFINLTKYFGSVKPLRDSCYLANQVSMLITDSTVITNNKKKITWFVGFMELEEAMLRLSSHENGVFLIRFNSNTPGEFAVNVKHENHENTVHNFLIKGDPLTACDDEDDYDGKFHLDRPDEKTFPTLVEFVRERLRCDYIDGIECIKHYPDSPLNSVFKGYK